MEKGRYKRIIAIAVLVLAVILIGITYFYALQNNVKIFDFVDNLIGILLPLIIGAIIAYLLKSTCNFFERLFLKPLSKIKKLKPRNAERIANVASIVVAYVIWTAAIGLLIAITVFQLVDSVQLFIYDLQHEYIDGIANFLLDSAGKYDFVVEMLGDENITRLQALIALPADQKISEVFDILVHNNLITTDMLTRWFGNEVYNAETHALDFSAIYSKVFSGTVMVISTTIDIVIAIVISVFILLGRKRLSSRLVLFLHSIFKKERVVNAIVDEAKFADRMFGGFLEGKVIDSTIVGLIYYVVLTLIGVPYAPMVAVICGVTNIIPIFGPFIGAFPSSIIILAADYTKVIPFIIFVFICQFVDGYIIDPHIVGGNINLPSIWVIVAVIVFGGLWGFPGLLIGVPTFAVIYDIIGKAVAYLLKKNGKYHLFVEFKNEIADAKPKKRRRRKDKSAENTEDISDEELNVIAETVAESVADKVADSIVEAVAESMAEAIAQAIAENIPNNVDESVADSVTESVTEKVTGSVSEKVVEVLSGSKAEENENNSKGE